MNPVFEKSKVGMPFSGLNYFRNSGVKAQNQIKTKIDGEFGDVRSIKIKGRLKSSTALSTRGKKLM